MKFIDPHQDKWRVVVGEDGPMVTLTPSPNSLLTFLQWHSVRSHWPEGMPIGVSLGNADDVADLKNDVQRISLVALQFPKWVDGRAYTQARLLRTRLGFKGEIRATGDVLVDMMPMLQRTGFDSVLLRSDQDLTAAHRALTFFSGHYQGDTEQPQPVFQRGSA